MSTDHTPGPWEVVQPRTEANRSEYIEIEDGFGRTATVYGEIDDSETQATARLISAAPDLLEALQRMLRLWSAPDPGAIAAAHAAIAKAKGAV